jgi:hypothetical protein
VSVLGAKLRCISDLSNADHFRSSPDIVAKVERLSVVSPNSPVKLGTWADFLDVSRRRFQRLGYDLSYAVQGSFRWGFARWPG